VHGWDKYHGDKQLKLCISSYQRPNPNALKMEAKVTGHYVNSILATSEAKVRGYDEALMLDMNGHVAEAPGATHSSGYHAPNRNQHLP
jgi:branched-chain amino acid aminotransferase